MNAFLRHTTNLYLPAPPRRGTPKAIRPAKLSILILIFGLIFSLSGIFAPSAVAQAPTGSVTQTTAGDFAAVCAVPANVIVSDANGGELRLSATVEDYFNGTSVDTGRWLTGNVYSWYTVPPVVGSGVLTLDSSYLRSQANLQSQPVRFFEARALQRAGSGFAGWVDLGYYRALPPLDGNAVTPDTAMRLFISRDNNTTYVRGRDGDNSAPLYDVDIATQNLQQYHLFRIEWDAVETRFYVDGALQATVPGVSTLNTYAFLYHQTPTTSGSSPMQIDWVRAGAYPSGGTYTSCALDAGENATWLNYNLTADTPAGTGIALQTRTSLDGLSWSDWAAVDNGAVASPAGRFLQYQATLTTSNPLLSPELRELTFNYIAPPVNATDTPTPTLTSTAPPTPTETLAPTPTNTPEPTSTSTPGPTATNTPLPTNTATFTPLPTNTPTPSAPPVTDDFNRANSTNLGANWTERSGDWQIFSNTLRNASAGGDAVVTYGGTYTNAQISASVQYASGVGTVSLGTRLGAFSGGVPGSGYAAELNPAGLIVLWRVDNWAQLGSYQIPGYQSNQPVTLALYASGSTIRVDVNGVTRINATNTAFTSGAVGIWSYSASAANQHVLDDFSLVDMTLPSPTPTATLPPTATSQFPPTATLTPTATLVPTSTATSIPTQPANIVHNSAADFSPVCSVLNNAVVSDAAGGEIRLAASVEDYFNGTTIDTGRWLPGTVYSWYTVPPSVNNGVLTLDSAFLRSQMNLQSVPSRFFEARALQRATTNNAGWPDLGFFRALPPLDPNSISSDSALRLFVTRDTNTTYVRARDGDLSAPLIDIDIPTIDLRSYHLFRIEWTPVETRFYVDGVLQATIPGVSNLNTWAFLYNQTPLTSGGSPMQVDWVRAGAYPSSGSYTSCALDAGANVTWQTVSQVSDIPSGTGVSVQTRTSSDGVNWSNWAAVLGNAVTSPAGRFLQYRLDLSSTNAFLSPEVRQVSLAYGSGQAGPTNTPLPSATATLVPTSTNTALPTSTNTPLPTSTNTPLPTSTNTPLPTSTNTPTRTATPSATPITDLIFSNGFESGNLTGWSSSTTGGGDLAVNTAAALGGTFGMRALINDNTSIYVVDNTPAAETRYRARFYFDPNSITMSNGNTHYIFYGYTGTSTLVTRIEFRRNSGAYQVAAQIRNDGSTYTSTSYVTISDAPHSIEIDWRASSAAGANNGGLTLWVDGVQVGNVTGIDNDTRRIDTVWLGAVAGIDSGTRGTYYFDSFDSRRLNYIGP